MAIFNLFTGIWAKVAAVFAFIAGSFWLVILFQSKKISRLKRENQSITKKSEIQEEDAISKARLIANEQEAVLSMTKEVNKSDEKITVDTLNDL